MSQTARRQDGTKTAAKCITHIRKLNIRNLKYVMRCNTLTKKMEDLKKTVAMVLRTWR